VTHYSESPPVTYYCESLPVTFYCELLTSNQDVTRYCESLHAVYYCESLPMTYYFESLPSYQDVTHYTVTTGDLLPWVTTELPKCDTLLLNSTIYTCTSLNFLYTFRFHLFSSFIIPNKGAAHCLLKFRLQAYRPIFPTPITMFDNLTFVQCTVTHVFQPNSKFLSLTNNVTWRYNHATWYSCMPQMLLPICSHFLNYDLFRFSSILILNVLKQVPHMTK